MHLGWWSNELQGAFCLHLLSPGVTDMCAHGWLLCGSWRSELRSSRLCSKLHSNPLLVWERERRERERREKRERESEGEGGREEGTMKSSKHINALSLAFNDYRQLNTTVSWNTILWLMSHILSMWTEQMWGTGSSNEFERVKFKNGYQGTTSHRTSVAK